MGTNPVLDGLSLKGFDRAIRTFQNPEGFAVKNSNFFDCVSDVQGECNAEMIATVDNCNSYGSTVPINITGNDLDITVRGCLFKDTITYVASIFALNAFHFSGNRAEGGVGIIRLYGSNSGSFNVADQVTYDYASNSGFTSDWQHGATALSAASSAANTVGKSLGRTVIVGGDMYLAQGGVTTSNWLNTTDGTTVTPV